MRTAVLLIGYDRPDYFGEVLDSLMAQPEMTALDLHVVIDGGPGARQGELVELATARGPDEVTVTCRPDNWGIGRNLIGARRQLFAELGYDRVLLFEDDLVLQPHYLSVLLALSDWAHAHDDIGTVMAHTVTAQGEAWQAERLDQVVVTNRHFWGYAITREVWRRISPHLHDYEARFLRDRRYDRRPHGAIRRWMATRAAASPRTPERPLLDVPPEVLVRPFTPRFLSRAPTGQDAATSIALWCEGYWRLTTRVPRARYIGVRGVHFDASVYAAHGFDEQQVFSFAADEQPGPFTIVTEDETGAQLTPTEYH